MARQLYQLSNVQEAFAARIRNKVQGRREQAQERADDVPLLGWLLRPLAGWAFDSREGSNTRRGERGEEAVLGTLLRWLPETWCVFHNVVVEPQPEDFAQIDLLLVSTAGVYLVETKAWRGSYKGYRDNWHQREGQTWAKVDSPTAQVQRQARKLAWWLEQQRSLALPANMKRSMTPVVVFTQPQWLRVNQCSLEVFEGARSLIGYLQEQPGDVFTASQVETICDLIIRSPTPVLLPTQPQLAPELGRVQVSDLPRAEPVLPTSQAAAIAAPPKEPLSEPAPSKPVPHSAVAPPCPKCGATMVLRTAKQGANAGNQFFGCPNFPRCRSILPVGPSSQPPR